MVDKRGDRTRGKAAVTRARIMDSAAAVLADKGYTDTNLSDIAKAANMQSGSLYYHFDSKDALIEETLRFGITQTYVRVSAALDEAEDSDPVERLKLAIQAQASEALDRSTYTAAHLRTIGQIPAAISAKLKPEIARFNQLWRDVLVAAAESGAIRSDLDVTSVSLIIIGAISYSVEWPASTRKQSDEVVRTLVEIVLNGLTVR